MDARPDRGGHAVVVTPPARHAPAACVPTEKEFANIPCDLCGSQENLQRQQIKAMLSDWNRRFPGRIETMFRALCNVVPSHLADPKLHDFAGIVATGVADADGDTVFDEPEFAGAPGVFPLRVVEAG